jgi:hypothetical protein
LEQVGQILKNDPDKLHTAPLATYRVFDQVIKFVTTSVDCAIGPSVTMFSTDFSFQNLVFWNLFEFSGAEIT